MDIQDEFDKTLAEIQNFIEDKLKELKIKSIGTYEDGNYYSLESERITSTNPNSKANYDRQIDNTQKGIKKAMDSLSTYMAREVDVSAKQTFRDWSRLPKTQMINLIEQYSYGCIPMDTSD